MRRFAALGLAALAMFSAPAHADNPFDHIVPLVRPGDPMPSTVFTDQQGRRLSFSALRGTAAAVAFVYTRCTDACPIITQKMASVRAMLGDGPFTLVEMTIDPAHDNRAAIAAYAHRFGMQEPHWLVLTGRADALTDFERRVGVQAIQTGPSEFIHNDRVVLVAPDGTLAEVIDGSSWTPADLAAQLRHLAGRSASLADRFDLALGKFAAYCGSVIAGRSGIGDLLASIGVFALGIGAFFWLVRRTSAPKDERAGKVPGRQLQEGPADQR